MATNTRSYIHPDAKNTVLPHLIEHFPSALNQEYTINNPPSPESIVVTSFPPSGLPSALEPWAVGVTDFTRPQEAEFWFWSSVETQILAGNDNRDKERRFREAYPLLESIIALITTLYPEKEILAIASLHTSFFPFLPKVMLQRVSKVYTKLIFSLDTLPPPTASSATYEEKYQFRKLEDSDLEEVVATSEVYRTVRTLRKMSSTGAYLRQPGSDIRAHAWCFISREGSVSTLFVRPELRGEGLGKMVMRKELEKAFTMRQFVSADVAEDNEASMGVCRSLGAQKLCDAIWIDIYLRGFTRLQE
ncbi:hypothetical protein EW146_g7466 [Bondarzewia mesenterica]|uniref:N-acetyltransferase domain-containing protein n=1 Tax=Bondarzewia mesenterica TaxID=1095465 RepID=A0A4V3XE87_9AGAM|nr:hypothetical protein EW146_g7466 [Bondarzewia mesenterica]